MNSADEAPLLDAPSVALTTETPRETSTKPCSRCFLIIDWRALVCGHCQFEIRHYEDNLSKRKVTVMLNATAAPRRQRLSEYSQWLSKYGERTGINFLGNVGGAIVLGFLGCLMLLVPLLGWLVGGFMILVSVVALIKAFAAPITALFGGTPGIRRAERAKAYLLAQNTYSYLPCPACSKSLNASWPDAADAYLLCPSCKQKSFRFADKLLWVPYPNVTLSGSLKEFFRS